MYSENYCLSGKTTSNGVKFQDLRKKYPRFIYENYFWKISKNNLEILFNFVIKPDIYFKPKIVIQNIDKSKLNRIGKGALNNLIFHLGLIETVSYWKATCSPIIEIRAGYLNKKQINWWKDLIIKGMGQFFYENKIDFTRLNFFKISSGQGKPNFLKLKIKNLQATDFSQISKDPIVGELKNRVLVPMGGGKDSVITLELLKGAKKELSSFSLNPTKAVLKTMKIADCKPRTRKGSVQGKKPIIVRRKIDKKLLALNQKGFLNGHTPFSAYLAFLSFLVAVIFGQKYIALSNERSSNEGNVKYLPRTETKSLVRGLGKPSTRTSSVRGFVINHQWSKSFEFEKKFREYSKKYLFSGVKYFSFLRPLYEIQIAKLFSKYPKYFFSFLSCNEAYKIASGTKLPTKKWCGKCSKCLFVFIILYPFLKEKDLLKIFRKNLFEDKKLLPIMQRLIGERGFKPFECVGTKKESLVAFYLSYKKYTGDTCGELPFLLKYFEDKILNFLPPRFLSVSERFLRAWNNQHNLPEIFKKILQKEISKKN